MKKITKIILTLLLVILILLPLLFPLASIFTPAVFEENFAHSLDEKIERLKSIEEDKIVVIGGSSVAFGLDSKVLENNTGMPVVNFGVYAALGTKLMLDLSLPHIKDGDIVIVAPELDAQTLSLYFSGETTLRALDGALYPTLFDIPAEHYGTLLGASWKFTADKISYLLGDKPKYDGIYSAASFNEYGDIKSGMRPENEMMRYYDPNGRVNLDKEILSEDFAEYLNKYAESCHNKGAEVYYSWCPVNELSLKKGTTAEDILEFERYMEDKLDFKFISYLSDYILPANYFYDTNFHLNDTGALYRSITLAEDILLELGETGGVSEKLPEMPPLPPRPTLFDGVDENSVYFEYEILEDGSYMVSGVKDEYKNLTELTLPLGYNGFKVTAIGPNAFKNTAVRKLIIPEDTNIRTIMNGSFDGAGELRELWIYYPIEKELTPPDSFGGVRSDFVVYVPADSEYREGYYWSQRNLTFKLIK